MSTLSLILLQEQQIHRLENELIAALERNVDLAKQVVSTKEQNKKPFIKRIYLGIRWAISPWDTTFRGE